LSYSYYSQERTNGLARAVRGAIIRYARGY
jgi:hypothetical protein